MGQVFLEADSYPISFNFKGLFVNQLQRSDLSDLTLGVTLLISHSFIVKAWALDKPSVTDSVKISKSKV